MKPVLVLTLAVSLALSACAGFTPKIGSGDDKGGKSVVDAIVAVASDPRCAHTDRLQGNLGGLTGNNLSVFVERVCPADPTAKPVEVKPLSALSAGDLG